jgi:cellulose biosynthesis protein BcsQ
MKVLVVGLSKGGVGKSTLALMICDELAVRRQCKVLAIDHDPQGSLAKFLLPPMAEIGENPGDLWSLAQGARDVPSLANAIEQITRKDQCSIETAPGAPGRLDLIAPFSALNFANVTYSAQRFTGLHTEALSRALRQAFVHMGYDYVVIDTPGSESAYTLPTVGLADALIVPVIPEPVTRQELNKFLDIVRAGAPNDRLRGLVLVSQVRINEGHHSDIQALKREFSAPGHRHHSWVRVLNRRLMYRMDFGRALFPRDGRGAYRKHKNIKEKYREAHEEMVRAVVDEIADALQ